MVGREVFRHAVTNIAEAITSSLSSVDLTIGDVDWFVPHQANSRILDGTARKLLIPKDKIIVTVAKHGNTSAASVPLALAEGVADGRIKTGDLVLFEAMGGGLTWGSALVRM
jgi:3-oxoacyl-[acyl-carrier-protein] synthase-3